MGLDGGTKPTRSDVLRGQSWRLAQADTSRSTRGGNVTGTFQPPQLDEQTRRAVLWSCCPLSGLPLQPPLVCDALGQLINRQALLEHLLATKSVFEDEAARVRHSNQLRAGGSAFDHITSLRDVFSVALTDNPDYHQQQQQQGQKPPAAAGHGAGSSQQEVARWVCPVTLLPCASKQPFSALKPCGHVLSAKALAGIMAGAASDGSGSSNCCPVCGRAFDSSRDVVLVNGSSEHMEQARARLQQKAAAKKKKRRRQEQQQQLLLDQAPGSQPVAGLLEDRRQLQQRAGDGQQQQQLQQQEPQQQDAEAAVEPPQHKVARKAVHFD